MIENATSPLPLQLSDDSAIRRLQGDEAYSWGFKYYLAGYPVRACVYLDRYRKLRFIEGWFEALSDVTGITVQILNVKPDW